MLLGRFTLNPQLDLWAPDGPEVRYGALVDGRVWEVPGYRNSYAVDEVLWLPPSLPGKIVCVGRNYADHAKELGNEVPSEPLIFLKPPSSLSAHNRDVVYPTAAQRVDFEGELAVIIGRRARNVSQSEALKAVAGFSILNDFTARDLQRKDVQFTRGKGFDTFCPIGPVLVPASYDFRSAFIETRVDGQLKQQGPVSDMIFSVSVIIEFVSRIMTLEPGDVIATGTPPGVGPVEPGSLVEVSISGIGTLKNRIVRP